MREYLDDDLGLPIAKPTEQQARAIGSNPPPDEEPYKPTGEEIFKPARKPDIFGPDLKTEKIFVKDTGNELTGRGLYASKDFGIGEHVFEFEGRQRAEKFRSYNAIDGYSAHSIVIGHNQGTFFVYVIPNKFNPLRYLNHSCDPNVARLSDDLFGFVAIKPIKTGEELTADYSLLEVNPYWELGECGCGSKNCRHKIRSACSLSAEYLCQNWQRLIPEMQEAALQYSRETKIAALRNQLGAEYMRDHNDSFLENNTFDELLNSKHPSTAKTRNLFGAQELAKIFLEKFGPDSKQENNKPL